MILSTTDVIQGEIVSAYLGIVTAEVVFDFQPVIGQTTLFGGAKALQEFEQKRQQQHQEALAVLKQSQENALAELEERAIQLDADAVVGIQIDRMDISLMGHSTRLIRATGTAIKFSKH
jgi:uncharacterized protein YbjQ (UPF0145 family)